MLTISIWCSSAHWPLLSLVFRWFWGQSIITIKWFPAPKLLVSMVFNGFGVFQPLVSMVFNGHGPLVQRCDGFISMYHSPLPCSFVCSSSCYGDSRLNLHFFQYIQALKPHINPVTLQFQAVPSYTDLVPPSTNQYHNDPVPSWINQFCSLLYILYNSTALYCISTTKYKPVLLHSDTVPPSTN